MDRARCDRHAADSSDRRWCRATEAHRPRARARAKCRSASAARPSALSLTIFSRRKRRGRGAATLRVFLAGGGSTASRWPPGSATRLVPEALGMSSNIARRVLALPVGPDRPGFIWGARSQLLSTQKEVKRGKGLGVGTQARSECSLPTHHRPKVASMAQNWRDPELPLFAEAKRINDPERALKDARRRGEGLHALPALQERDPDRVRRGPG